MRPTCSSLISLRSFLSAAAWVGAAAGLVVGAVLGLVADMLSEVGGLLLVVGWIVSELVVKAL